MSCIDFTVREAQGYRAHKQHIPKQSFHFLQHGSKPAAPVGGEVSAHQKYEGEACTSGLCKIQVIVLPAAGPDSPLHAAEKDQHYSYFLTLSLWALLFHSSHKPLQFEPSAATLAPNNLFFSKRCIFTTSYSLTT